MDNRPAGLLGGGFGAFAPQNLYAGLLGNPNPQMLPEINVDAARQPGADAHDFVRQQLQSGEPQLSATVLVGLSGLSSGPLSGRRAGKSTQTIKKNDALLTTVARKSRAVSSMGKSPEQLS